VIDTISASTGLIPKGNILLSGKLQEFLRIVNIFLLE
jgi:hypothetical protein